MNKYLKILLIGGAFIIAYIFFAKWAKKKNLAKIFKSENSVEQNNTSI